MYDDMWSGLGLFPFAGAMAGWILFCVIFLSLGVYIYSSLAWMTIARKLKHKYPWLAWIPFANVALMLQLGGFHWAWVFLFLVPFFGWLALLVLIIVCQWKVYERRKYPGVLSLVPLLGFVPFLGWVVGIAQLVIIGIVAWVERK